MKKLILFLLLLPILSSGIGKVQLGNTGNGNLQLGNSGNGDLMMRNAFTFNNVANTTSNLKLVKAGTNAWVNWGDGTIEQVSQSAYTTHTYASAYTGEVKIWSDDGNQITQFWSTLNHYSFDVADMPRSITFIGIFGSNTISGDVAGFPAGATYINIQGSNTISGDVAGFPAGVTTIAIYGSNTISGDVAGFPAGATYILITGSNTISGDVAGFPAGLTYIDIYGSNTISGDVAGFPAGLTYINIRGSNTISAYTAGRTWANNMVYVGSFPTAGSGLDATEVDNLLIDLAVVAAWTGSKVINIAGNNAARTAASDAAVAVLEGKGVTVITN